mgnify:CR=1 FL=1
MRGSLSLVCSQINLINCELQLFLYLKHDINVHVFCIKCLVVLYMRDSLNLCKPLYPCNYKIGLEIIGQVLGLT